MVPLLQLNFYKRNYVYLIINRLNPNTKNAVAKILLIVSSTVQ